MFVCTEVPGKLSLLPGWGRDGCLPRAIELEEALQSTREALCRDPSHFSSLTSLHLSNPGQLQEVYQVADTFPCPRDMFWAFASSCCPSTQTVSNP